MLLRCALLIKVLQKSLGFILFKCEIVTNRTQAGSGEQKCGMKLRSSLKSLKEVKKGDISRPFETPLI